MTSFFSKDSFLQLPSLKRSPRTRINRARQTSSKRTSVGVCSPSTLLKGRMLHAIPELCEANDDDGEELEEQDVEEVSTHSHSHPRSGSLYPSSRHPTNANTSPANSTRSRNSSTKSIADLALETRVEARLSAYEFSIDDALFLPPLSPASPSPPPSHTPSHSHTPSPSPPSNSISNSSYPSSHWIAPASVPDSDIDYFSTTTTPVTPAYITALASSPDSDSFRLTFSDVSLRFPHPPLSSPSPSSSRSSRSIPGRISNSHGHSHLHPHIQTPSLSPHSHSNSNLNPNPHSMSPTPSISASSSSSPSSHNSDLPITPTSSDDEFPLSPVHVRARRASIKPLFIAKVNSKGGMTGRSRSAVDVDVLCADYGDDEREREGVQRERERVVVAKEHNVKKRVYALSDRDGDGEDSSSETESDYESLNDWYTQQFSDILTLASPSPVSSSPSTTSPQSQASPFTPFSPFSPTFSPARPDSILSLSPPPRRAGSVGGGGGARAKKRESKPLPEIPVVLMPSTQLDPTFPRRKRTIMSGSFLAPTSNANANPMSQPAKRGRQHRPSPQNSVLMDLSLELRVEGDDEWVDENGDEEPGFVDTASQSSASLYSQDTVTPVEGTGVDLAEYAMEDDTITMPLRLPLSLPTSPVDLEEEFVTGLEQLALSQSLTPFQLRSQPRRSSSSRVIRAGVPSALMIPKPEVEVTMMEPAMPETPASHMYSPTPFHFPPFTPSTLTRSTTTTPHTTNNNNNEMQSQQNMERVLRSRWSSSTLSSQREREREIGMGKKRESRTGTGTGKEPKSASSRLKFYFSARSKKGQSKRISASSTTAVMSPVSPFFPFPATPRSPMGYMLPPTPPPSNREFSGGGPSSQSRSQSQLQRGRMSTESQTLRRSASRSSTSTNASYCGSVGGHSECGSCDSAGSSGLRRKPIPVDLLIKC